MANGEEEEQEEGEFTPGGASPRDIARAAASIGSSSSFTKSPPPPKPLPPPYPARVAQEAACTNEGVRSQGGCTSGRTRGTALCAREGVVEGFVVAWCTPSSSEASHAASERLSKCDHLLAR